MRTFPILIATAVLVAATGSFGCSKKSSSPTAPGGGNHAPTIGVNSDKLKLWPSTTAQITVTASDADGDQLTFTYSAVRGTVQASGPTATVATFTAGTQVGAASVTVTADDGQGGSAQATADLYIRNPSPPAFTLVAVSQPGGPETSKYLVLTTPEAVTITGINASRCVSTSSDFVGPVDLPVGGQLVIRPPGGGAWLDIGMQPGQCGLCVQIYGRRAEPDGGDFSDFRCAY